jgi:GT2 family glycosyltransferase
MTHIRSIRLAVVIPVHNRKAITVACLSQLRNIDHTNAVLDIIVVDDGSTDGTADASRAQSERVTVLEGDGNLWWTGAVNIGVVHALRGTYDYILILNDDLLLDHGFLTEMLNVAKANPGSLVSSVKLNKRPDGTERIVAAGFRDHGWLQELMNIHGNRSYGAVGAAIRNAPINSPISGLVA